MSWKSNLLAASVFKCRDTGNSLIINHRILLRLAEHNVVFWANDVQAKIVRLIELSFAQPYFECIFSDW